MIVFKMVNETTVEVFEGQIVIAQGAGDEEGDVVVFNTEHVEPIIKALRACKRELLSEE